MQPWPMQSRYLEQFRGHLAVEAIPPVRQEGDVTIISVVEEEVVIKNTANTTNNTVGAVKG